MEETTMYAELKGGVLDGMKKVVCKKSPPNKLILKNPNPLTYQSKLCQPLTLTQVVYVLVFYDDTKAVYVFEGHTE